MRNYKNVCVLILCIIAVLCLASTSHASSMIAVMDSGDQGTTVVLDNADDLNAINFTITPFPQSLTNTVSNAKIFDFNPEKGKCILYGLDRDTPIPSGQILIINYNGTLTGNTTITITEIAGANALAESVSDIVAESGYIELLFKEIDVIATAYSILGITPTKGDPRDANNDGVYDIRDMIVMVNKGIERMQ